MRCGAPSDPRVRCVRVADAEADIYDYLKECSAHNHQFVVRLYQDRAVIDPETGERLGSLFEVVRSTPAITSYELELRRRPGPPAPDGPAVGRLRPALRPRAGGPGQVGGADLVLVRAGMGGAPPAGVKALEWVLTCGFPVTGPEDALCGVGIYAQRPLVEKVFHQITDVFSLEHLIGSSPRAVLFQPSFCPLLYNTLQVLRAHLAWHQACSAEKISTEKLFYDVREELVSVRRLIPDVSLLALLGEAPTAAALRAYLRGRLRGVWSKRWWRRRAPGVGAQEGEDARAG